MLVNKDNEQTFFFFYEIKKIEHDRVPFYLKRNINFISLIYFPSAHETKRWQNQIENEKITSAVLFCLVFVDEKEGIIIYWDRLL